MRICFLGTPAFAVPALDMLVREGYDIIGVVTQPDKPRSRGHKTVATPVKLAAERFGLPVYQFDRIRDNEGVETLKAMDIDLMVTAAFGQILSAENLDIPRIGCINIHASLLPKYRGPAPIERAIWNGETQTGITSMMTDIGVDTGDMLLRRSIDILPDETAGELRERMATLGADVLHDTLKALETGDMPRIKQDNAQASHAPIIKKDEGLINWQLPFNDIHNRIRACTPQPGAYVMAGDSRCKVLAVKRLETNSDAAPGSVVAADAKQGLIVRCADACVLLETIQMPGGKALNSRDYLRGHAFDCGVLG